MRFQKKTKKIEQPGGRKWSKNGHENLEVKTDLIIIVTIQFL
jgi:hypothetical protein